MDQELHIIETLFVSPSPSPPLSGNGPVTVLPLSCLDSYRIRFPTRTLRIYPHSTSSTSDPVRVFANALSKALFHFYPLAGTLHRLADSGLLTVRCSACDSVCLTIATSPIALASFQIEPGSEFLNRLAPNSVEAAMALQVTRFACGGTALGMCVHHALCDGLGAAKFLRAVAGFVRGEDKIRVEPTWDRLELLGSRNPPRVEEEFGKLFGLTHNGSSENPEESSVQECFHVSEVHLNLFRNRLSEQTGLDITSFEALAAFVWRARVKALDTASKEEVKLEYWMNISKLLKPPLPDGYWGNVCVLVYVKLSVQQLLNQPVSETAKLINKSKHSVTDEYVRSYIDFQELHYAKGITASNFVSQFSDWRHLGHSEVDLGWGSPSTVLPLTWQIHGCNETYFLTCAMLLLQKGR